MTGPRTALAAASALLLAGCGFHPLYGAADRDAVAHLPDIFVQPIPERAGQELRLALQQRLAGASQAQPQGYTLAVSFSVSSEAIGIHGDNTAERNRLVGRAHWTLASVSPAPATLTSGDARSLDGFNIINEQFFAATLAGDTTQQRLADNLADTIAEQLATWFNTHAPPASAAIRATPSPTLAPRDVPADTDQSPLTAPGDDGLPASAIGRGNPDQQ